MVLCLQGWVRANQDLGGVVIWLREGRWYVVFRPVVVRCWNVSVKVCVVQVVYLVCVDCVVVMLG